MLITVGYVDLRIAKLQIIINSLFYQLLLCHNKELETQGPSIKED